VFSTASRRALWSTQSPNQQVLGALSPGLKRPLHEADHSSPSSVEDEMRGAIPPLPQYVFMAWCLVKHRDNFNLVHLRMYRIILWLFNDI
jgi:hypothetical protein